MLQFALDYQDVDYYITGFRIIIEEMYLCQALAGPNLDHVCIGDDFSRRLQANEPPIIYDSTLTPAFA